MLGFYLVYGHSFNFSLEWVCMPCLGICPDTMESFDLLLESLVRTTVLLHRLALFGIPFLFL